MTTSDNRKHPRIKTENLISYIGIDDSGNEVEQGVGKTIDISIGGILIETNKLIASKDILLTTVGTKDKISNISGKVVYRWAEDSGMFLTGIQFIEHNEENRLFIISLIKDYSKQKTQH